MASTVGERSRLDVHARTTDGPVGIAWQLAYSRHTSELKEQKVPRIRVLSYIFARVVSGEW